MTSLTRFFVSFCMVLSACLTTAHGSGIYIFEDIAETIGCVQSISGSILHVRGEAVTANGEDDILVDIIGAPVYDLRTGFLVDVEYISPGMCARVAYDYYGAIVVWLNCNHSDAAVFTAEVSENIIHYDGYSVFLSACGKYRIVLDDETQIIDPIYGILAPSNITAGIELFIWVDMITASSPSLVYPEKVVVVYG